MSLCFTGELVQSSSLLLHNCGDHGNGRLDLSILAVQGVEGGRQLVHDDVNLLNSSAGGKTTTTVFFSWMK